MSDPLLTYGSEQRAAYLRRRALRAAIRLIGHHQDLDDLTNDITLWALRRDERARLEGEPEPPKYTAQCFRWVGIDLLRRARKTHRRDHPAYVHSLDELKHSDAVDRITPEVLLSAKQEVRRRVESHLAHGRRPVWA